LPEDNPIVSRIILVAGTGRCGLVSLVSLLSQQVGTRVTLEDPPLLPWRDPSGGNSIVARLARLRRGHDNPVLAEAAAFYLPYLEDAILTDPGIRILALRRPRHEVVPSFERFLDEHNPFPTNHWAMEPAVGWMYDPLWTQTFPQYDTSDRAAGIGRYWDEYNRRLDELATQYPDNLRIFEMNETLNTESGQRSLLNFAGYSSEQQVINVGVRAHRIKPNPPRPRARPTSKHPLDPGRCVILVPFTGFIHPPCENGLRELERRGYQVRRVGGYAAIDQGRNQLATDALLDGFEETMWIDSDVEFHPDSVDQLRAHGLPITCGIYPQKGRKAIACHVMPGTPKLNFGKTGGVIEVLYAATGFLLVRRAVYLKMQYQLSLPVTNERFGSPMIPFFLPMLHPIEDGMWYLAEDYAFSERARQCGFKIVADSNIRLWHHGNYPYGWEDAGIQRERTDSFTLHLVDKPTESGKEPKSPTKG
jgi:hypothetical protein